MLQKFDFFSSVAGLKILFLGAIHGNETCGPKAIHKVIQQFNSSELSLIQGQVSFIPVCNPQAYQNSTRQIDENLNRIIQKYTNPCSYEQHLANELVDYISAYDVIIDLHSVQAKTAKPFIFSDYPDPLADKIISSLGIDYCITGWPEIYAQSSDIKDLSTGNCAHTYHRSALTVECGSNTDALASLVAYNVIINTLTCLNLIKGQISASSTPAYINMSAMYKKEFSGSLTQDFHHLDKVKKGQILAIYDNGQKIICPYDSYILLPKFNAPCGFEWFYLGYLA